MDIKHFGAIYLSAVIFNFKTTLFLKTLTVYNQSLWVFRTGQLDNNQFFVVINDLIECTLLHLYYCPKNQFRNDFFSHGIHYHIYTCYIIFIRPSIFHILLRICVRFKVQIGLWHYFDIIK